MQSNSRTKKTALVMFSNLFTTILTSLFSLAINQKILTTLGSDYNGVNSTVAQIVTILSLLEGGFTIAAQVALYKPVALEDNGKISQLITYTARKMRKYGIWTLLVGIVLSIAYAGFVKSGLSYYTILSVMILAVFGAAYNLSVVSKYRILFQVTQTEYKCVYVNIASQFFLLFAVYFVLKVSNNKIISVRIVYLLVEIIRGVWISILAKKNFKFVDYHVNVKGVRIKGTKDVFFSKITSLIYSSAPVLFISTFIGTASTSVYALYLTIINSVLSLLNSVAYAPTHGLGQLIAEADDENKHHQLLDVYSDYETLIAIANAFLCSVTFVMLRPFVSLYTRGVTDMNYTNIFYAIIMVLILLVQIIHMPSGICINVAGEFKAMRNIQILASIVLVVLLPIGVWLGGLEGLLLGKLLTAIILAIIEIAYNYKKVIRCSIIIFIRIALTTYLPAIALCFAEYFFLTKFLTVDSWITWVLLGCVIFVLNFLFIILINLALNRKIMTRLINRILIPIFRKKVKK